MIAMGLSLVRIGEFSWSCLEPNDGQFEFEWLDKAINILGKAGLSVILGTPSATPPRWVLNKFPDILAADKNGNLRKFGSRRHYCFSHTGYRKFAAQMAGRLAARYADNPFIEFWQIDNEYGCHDTILSYSQSAQDSFRTWLKNKYGTIDKLNTSWGNVFWSMEYSNFNEIDLPNLTVTEPNPAHVVDFRRFSSDQVVLWNKAQCDAIREHCTKPLMHNYMGRITDFDHFKLGEDLDIAGWDSYPLGFLEDRSDRSEAFKQAFKRQGDLDFQAFHHDIYRAVGNGQWGVMEQQPGPVNWAPYNPAPLPGMVRLWTWEAIAHGAQFVCYFRWRQAPFGQEQMHTALKRADNTEAPVCDEVRQVAAEIDEMQIDQADTAKVGLIFDYESQWAWETQPQSQDFDYFRLVFDFFCALRTLDQPVDIVSVNSADLQNYDYVIIPGLYCLKTDLAETLKAFKGKLLVGPRFNQKDQDFKTNMRPLKSLTGADFVVQSIETMRPSETTTLDKGNFQIWQEVISSNFDPVISRTDGLPALLANERLSYLTGWPDSTAMVHLLEYWLDQDFTKLPTGLRVKHFENYTIYLNYTGQDIVFNDLIIQAAGIAIQQN